MQVFVATYDYFKRTGKVDTFNVDDGFIQFIHKLKGDERGGSAYSTMAYLVTDNLLNSTGFGWKHTNGIDIGVGESKQQAISALFQSVEKSGEYDQEDMGHLKKAFQQSGLSESDKAILRKTAGILTT